MEISQYIAIVRAADSLCIPVQFNAHNGTVTFTVSVDRQPAEDIVYEYTLTTEQIAERFEFSDTATPAYEVLHSAIVFAEDNFCLRCETVCTAPGGLMAVCDEYICPDCNDDMHSISDLRSTNRSLQGWI